MVLDMWEDKKVDKKDYLGYIKVLSQIN